MNILLFIFLFFATFSSSSTLIRRQDALSGFKPCIGGGTFPNEITTYTFTPNPLVAGQTATGRIAGKATVPIENGALYNITTFHENQIFLQHIIDFCQMFVIPNGSTCPINGDYDFTINFPVEPSTNVVNTSIEYDARTLIINPDGNILSCIEGKITFHYP
uniref:Phosphatidylglycerol/phosphatidylinositol transfer protein n=1 Tax=Rhizophagus irregularis (strain DAOM 181602 / DAOM 197198 / MUCL 43194) TaxID=747089 RepID=U9UQD7_RHIID